MALKLKQKRMAELMVQQPELTNEKYAEMLNVDPSTIYRWKKNKEFTDYIHSLCDARFRDMERLAIQKLKEHIKNDNWKATQFVLENMGYKPDTKVDITSNDINICVTGDSND